MFKIIRFWRRIVYRGKIYVDGEKHGEIYI